MDRDLLLSVAEVAFAVVTFLLGKYAFPKIPKNKVEAIKAGLDLITNYAEKYVAWAKHFKESSTGEEKMDLVVSELAKIAEKGNINISEIELRAIAQRAYLEMKRGESQVLTSGAIDADTIYLKSQNQ